jgi:hypothetical protein
MTSVTCESTFFLYIVIADLALALFHGVVVRVHYSHYCSRVAAHRKRKQEAKASARAVESSLASQELKHSGSGYGGNKLKSSVSGVELLRRELFKDKESRDQLSNRSDVDTRQRSMGNTPCSSDILRHTHTPLSNPNRDDRSTPGQRSTSRKTKKKQGGGFREVARRLKETGRAAKAAVGSSSAKREHRAKCSRKKAEQQPMLTKVSRTSSL